MNEPFPSCCLHASPMAIGAVTSGGAREDVGRVAMGVRSSDVRTSNGLRGGFRQNPRTTWAAASGRTQWRAAPRLLADSRTPRRPSQSTVTARRHPMAAPGRIRERAGWQPLADSRSARQPSQSTATARMHPTAAPGRIREGASWRLPAEAAATSGRIRERTSRRIPADSKTPPRPSQSTEAACTHRTAASSRIRDRAGRRLPADSRKPRRPSQSTAAARMHPTAAPGRARTIQSSLLQSQPYNTALVLWAGYARPQHTATFGW